MKGFGAEGGPMRRGAKISAITLAILMLTVTLSAAALAYRSSGDKHAKTMKGHIDLGFKDKQTAQECAPWNPPFQCMLRADTSYQTWSIEGIMEEQYDEHAQFDLLGGLVRDPGIWMVCIYDGDPGPDPRCVDDETDVPSSLLQTDVDADIRTTLSEDARYMRVFLARAHDYDYRIDVTVD